MRGADDLIDKWEKGEPDDDLNVEISAAVDKALAEKLAKTPEEARRVVCTSTTVITLEASLHG